MTVSFCNKSPYDKIADVYDDIDWWGNPYYGPICACEKDVVNEWVATGTSGLRALDIGSGTGFHTEWLVEKGYATVGIDVSPEMLRVARLKSQKWRSQPELLLCDARDMSKLSEGCFDVVTCLGSTLNHIDDWCLLSNQISLRMRPGAQFIFSLENFFGIDTLFWFFKRGRNGYEVSKFRQYINDNIRHLVKKEALHNHWPMEIGEEKVEVPLTYDTKRRFLRGLSQVGLEVKMVRGVHFLTCFFQGVLEASVNVKKNVRETNGSQTNSAFVKLESWFTKRLPSMCAAIVGVAVKQ